MPAGAAQQFCDFLIPGFVALEFRDPIVRIGVGISVMFRAAVPEAPLHKKGQACLAKNKVWISGHLLPSAPAGDAVCFEDGYEPQLGIAIAFGLNCGHYA